MRGFNFRGSGTILRCTTGIDRDLIELQAGAGLVILIVLAICVLGCTLDG